MRGRRCLWDEEKGMDGEGGKDGVGSCEMGVWT